MPRVQKARAGGRHQNRIIRRSEGLTHNRGSKITCEGDGRHSYGRHCYCCHQNRKYVHETSGPSEPRPKLSAQVAVRQEHHRLTQSTRKQRKDHFQSKPLNSKAGPLTTVPLHKAAAGVIYAQPFTLDTAYRQPYIMLRTFAQSQQCMVAEQAS